MDSNTIWNEILLKNVRGGDFCHATTITEMDRKYQVFEVLVAETLARIQPEMKWRVTVGSGDGGIDFIATSTLKDKTPFIDNEIEQIILGQIKRRSSGYRYDDFRNDISSAFESYMSSYIFRGKSLLKLLFVISTDNRNNVQNLKGNLEEDFTAKTRISFIANIRSPIHIINADDIIKYWKHNFAFVSRLLSSFVSEEEMKNFKQALNEVEDDYIQVSVGEIGAANIGEIVKIPINIRSSTHGVPVEYSIRWTCHDAGAGKLQLITPLDFLADELEGIHIKFIDEYQVSMFFRALSEGEYDLGTLNIFAADGKLVGSFNLGNMTFYRSLMPIYQTNPNKDVSDGLYLALTSMVCQYGSFIVTGDGGIGKSFLLKELMLRLSNQRYLCISVRHPHRFMTEGEFIRELIYKLISSQLHVFCVESEMKQQLILFLGAFYSEDWSTDVDALFCNKSRYNIISVSSIVVSIIIKISMKQKLILWLNDLHWLCEEDANFVMKMSQTLERNQRYLPLPVRLILEGRKDEAIIYDNKIYFPQAWHNLQSKINSTEYSLKPWKNEDTENFIASILSLTERKQDYELYLDLYRQLLGLVSGNPMHIIEQIRYMVQQQKLRLNQDGQLFITDSEWKCMNCTKLKELVHSRLLFFAQQYPDYSDWLILYAKFENVASESLKKFICKRIQRTTPLYEKIALESNFFKFCGTTIEFQHEYYSENLKTLCLQSETHKSCVLKWLESQKALSDEDILCKIEMISLCDMPDYKKLVKEALKIIKQNQCDSILLSIYTVLAQVPEKVLNSYGLERCVIYYRISQITVRLGSYEIAEGYLKQILSKRMDSPNYVYYSGLAYQQLSNISSAKLKLKSAITYADSGLDFIQRQGRYETLAADLKKIQIILICRQSINYAFSGDWNRALYYQKQAVHKALKMHIRYLTIRIAYERSGLLLHKSLSIHIERLNFLYQCALKIPEMYPTELYLIRDMELVGRLVLYQNNLNEINSVYKDALEIEHFLQNKNSTYIMCTNYLILGTCCLLLNHDTEHALLYFFRATEHALDSGRSEMLWKCYTNIAQLYYNCGQWEEARNYAQKGLDIIKKVLIENSNPGVSNILYTPLNILENILRPQASMIHKEKQHDRLETLSVVWDSKTIFLMK